MIAIFITVALVLILSGLFSGSEAALVSITDAEVESMEQQGVIGAKTLVRVRRHLARAVIAIVIMNNAVNIAGSITVGNMVIQEFGNAVLAVTTTALTFGVIIFSEIIPKSLGMHYAQRAAILLAPIIWALMVMLSPVIIALEALTNLLKRGERKIGTEEQIRSLVSIGRRAGHIESDEGQLIHRAFILNDKRASDIMTPLKDIVGIPLDATVKEAAQKVFHNTYSRYPVFGQSIHDIKGIVMSQDILESLAEGKDKTSVGDIMREGLIIKATTRSDSLLAHFRDRHIHLGIVQDEGKTVGLVTLEDVLEELVGEIEDETDVED